MTECVAEQRQPRRSAAAGMGGAAAPREPVSSLAESGAVIAAWLQRYRYRCELARLLSTGRHLIEDIGLRPQDAQREAAKPFWRP